LFLKLNGRENFFLSKSFSQKIVKKSNIILSPEFYWVKRVELNVNFSYEVKKMAPSIFEDMLPSGVYEYSVLKVSKKNFIVMAFDIQRIKSDLESLGIDLKFVNKIYLAQSEFSCKEDLKIDDNFGLTCVDSVVTIAPLSLLDASKSVEDYFKKKSLSSNYVFLNRFKDFKVDSKLTGLSITILILLNLLLALDIVSNIKKSRSLSSKKEKFIRKYNLPQTSFQLKSIESELKKIDKRQMDFRKSVDYIGRFKLGKKESFNNLVFDKNRVELSLKLASKKREKEFDEYIKKLPKSSLDIKVSYEK